MTQPDPNANDSQNPEPDSSAQGWPEESSGLLELVDKTEKEQERRKWEELMQQAIEEQERLEQEQLDREDRESDQRLLNWWLEQERLEQEQERLEQEQEQERATWNRDSSSDNFAGYHVRRPDGSWYRGGNEDPAGQDLNEQSSSDNFPGRGHRLGTGELPPGHERGENAPEQTAVARRRAAALAAIERRQVTDRSTPTRGDESQSYGR
jgi:hypothetical protein